MHVILLSAIMLISFIISTGMFLVLEAALLAIWGVSWVVDSIMAENNMAGSTIISVINSWAVGQYLEVFLADW